MVLGHEVAGRISALGREVTGLAIGDLVAINPSQPCGTCEYCEKAQYNQCLDMRYYGSAMRFPHVHGALEVVATDVEDAPLICAHEVGADRTINVATHADELNAYGTVKGTFDVVIEASGNGHALMSALEVIRPLGRLIQLGLGGEVTIPLNLLVAKEIELCGTFRFHEEFAWAVSLINAGRLPLKPMLTAVYPVDEAVAAFEAASDRSANMKVQLAFT